MTTVAELRDVVFPAAIEVIDAPGRAAGRAHVVGWVRVMRARVPAFDALEPNDLVVVPAAALAVVAPDETTAGALVDALGAADVAGVVLVGEPPPDAFAARVARAGIAAYLLARGDPGTLERSAIGFLVNRDAELERLAGGLERRLEALALGERGLDALVSEVATTLGRAAALEDRLGRAVSVQAPAGVDPSTAARYVAGTGGGSWRVSLPARSGATGGGALVVLGDAPATELERLATQRIAPLLALALARDDAVRTARDSARRGEALPAAGPPWVLVVARQANWEAAGGEAGAARAEDAGRTAELLRRDVRLLAPARRLALRGDATSLELRVVLAGDEDDPHAEGLTARLAALVGRPVARSRPFERPGDRAVAEAEARATLETWEQLATAGAGEPLVLRAERLAAYRLLVGVHNLPGGRRDAEALLAPLLVGRPPAVRERLATLRAVLGRGAGAEAAAALGIHRNTLAYRVRRIETMTGWRLGDPDIRLPLMIALELVHNDQ
ncbi:MAG TPA: helix-turn-helix domain-containing protein [Candidatus Limnocylindrales bacterium]|nr:helix-turn-helix domain-containing protein [Candidatus Limnocylindrales bacterium]